MGNYLYLASEAASEAGSEGFGFNFDILETNLINLSILVGLLIFYGRKFVGNILRERRAKIEQEIKDAETRAQEAAASLADAQQKLAQAQAEAEKIRSNAQETAKKSKESILSGAAQEVERIKAAASQEMDSEQAIAIAELRQRIATLALERAESQLKGCLDDPAQKQLVNRSIAQLGGG